MLSIIHPHRSFFSFEFVEYRYQKKKELHAYAISLMCGCIFRVLDAYRTGRGRVVVRGKTKVEMLDAKTKRNAVIITEVIGLVCLIMY